MISLNDISSNEEERGSLRKTIEQVKLNPNDWPARKLAASILHDLKKYTEAAELIWCAPELPYRSQDIAFSVRIIAKDNPKKAILLVKEVIRRNGKNTEGGLRLAKAFHKEGLPLLASRMYGAAIAVSNDNFDIGFEQESLWFDDYGALVAEWQRQAYEPRPNEPTKMKEFLGKAISFLEYTQRITACVNISSEATSEATDLKVSDDPKLKSAPPPNEMTVPLLIPKVKPKAENK